MQEYAIKELIPQREPFIMVDRLITFEEGLFTSLLVIREGNFFAKDGVFRAEGMLENIAQTAAAGAGYAFKLNNEKVKLGYIGAVKNAEIISEPKIGSTITTQIELINKVFNVDIVRGTIYNENQEVLASCEMKIFIDS
jgi:3-hydroxymyristoyl/3-hydroxydecanoyl-(acyl carrier protein) dehydratase